jgi:SAM-dependent methyltransferase
MIHSWAGAPGKLQDYGPRFISRSRLIRRLVRAIRPNRTLDIGCGSGLITKVLAEASAEVVAVDVSDQAIAVSRAALGEATNVRLMVADVFQPRDAIGDWRGSFDLVVLSEVLEHIPDDEGALGTVWELLGEKGQLLLTVPGDPKLWNVEDERAGHVRRYTREELRRKLQKNGFQILRMVNWGFPITRWLYLLEVSLLLRRRPSRGRAKGLPLLLPLLALARPLFAVLADIESLISGLDRGVGYVVLARKLRNGSAIRGAAPTRHRTGVRLGTHYRWVLTSALWPPNGAAPRTLDVGCHDGFWLHHQPPGCSARVGCDLAPVALYSDIEYVRCDAGRLPFASGTFELCTAWDVLEHVSDDRALLGELSRVLRAGGRVRLSVPHKHIAVFPPLAMPWLHRRWQHSLRTGYVPSEIRSLAEASGFAECTVLPLRAPWFRSLYLVASLLWSIWPAAGRRLVTALALRDAAAGSRPKGLLLVELRKR